VPREEEDSSVALTPSLSFNASAIARAMSSCTAKMSLVRRS
jgi:hypothetical protein